MAYLSDFDRAKSLGFSNAATPTSVGRLWVAYQNALDALADAPTGSPCQARYQQRADDARDAYDAACIAEQDARADNDARYDRDVADTMASFLEGTRA